jgi:hypothetical protein
MGRVYRQPTRGSQRAHVHRLMPQCQGFRPAGCGHGRQALATLHQPRGTAPAVSSAATSVSARLTGIDQQLLGCGFGLGQGRGKADLRRNGERVGSESDWQGGEKERGLRLKPHRRAVRIWPPVDIGNGKVWLQVGSYDHRWVCLCRSKTR